MPADSYGFIEKMEDFQLFEASGNGSRADEMEDLLKEGADPNWTDVYGHNSVHNAVLHNEVACLDVLVNQSNANIVSDPVFSYWAYCNPSISLLIFYIFVSYIILFTQSQILYPPPSHLFLECLELEGAECSPSSCGLQCAELFKPTLGRGN